MRLRSASFSLAVLLGVFGFTLFVVTEEPPGSASPQESTVVQPVNAVLGNQSYRRVFGRAPTPTTPERLRLQTHLAVVGGLLRARDVSGLSPAQRQRRTTLLDALHEYWTDGRFPRNTEVPGRTPIFVDREGRLCAVGYLIAQSAGRDVARRIDQRYHFAHVREIDAPVLDQWAERHGFTRRELAMIQPAYRDPRPDPDPAKTASALEITSLSTSIGSSVVNGVLLERGSPSIVGGAVGMAGGATSLTIGLTDGAKYPTASALAGATSVALGTWSLIAALRGDDSSEPSPPPASAQLGNRWNVRLAPTTLTTMTGSTQPGVQATVQF